MKRIGRGFIILLVSIAIAAMTGWGALAIYYSNLPGEELRRAFGHCLRHFWRGGAALVPFLGQTKSSFLGFCRGFSAARCLVVDDSS